MAIVILNRTIGYVPIEDYILCSLFINLHEIGGMSYSGLRVSEVGAMRKFGRNAVKLNIRLLGDVTCINLPHNP